MAEERDWYRDRYPRGNNRHRTNLMNNVYNNSLDLLREELKDPKVKINKRDANGFTALAHAVSLKNLEAVKEILKHPDVNVNIATRPFRGSDMTFIHDVGTSLIDFVRELGIKEVDYDILHLIIKSGKLKFSVSSYRRFKIFLEDKGRKKCLNALKIYAKNFPENTHNDTKKYSGMSRETQNIYLSAIPLRSGDINNLDTKGQLIQGWSYYIEYRNKLHQACFDGNETKVRKLLEYKDIDVNMSAYCDLEKEYGEVRSSGGYNTPLTITVVKGNETIVDLLLERPDIDVNKKMIIHDLGPLILAVKYNNINIVKKLLNHKDIDPNQFTFFTKYFDVWNYGKRKGRKYNACSFAAANGYTDILKVLLESPKVARFNIRFALISAVENDQLEIVKYCLDISNQDNIIKFRRAKHKAFLIAAQNLNIDLMVLLLEHKYAKINIFNKPDEFVNNSFSMFKYIYLTNKNPKLIKKLKMWFKFYEKNKSSYEIKPSLLKVEDINENNLFINIIKKYNKSTDSNRYTEWMNSIEILELDSYDIDDYKRYKLTLKSFDYFLSNLKVLNKNFWTYSNIENLYEESNIHLDTILLKHIKLYNDSNYDKLILIKLFSNLPDLPDDIWKIIKNYLIMDTSFSKTERYKKKHEKRENIPLIKIDDGIDEEIDDEDQIN